MSPWSPFPAPGRIPGVALLPACFTPATRVVSLTNRPVPDPDPHAGAVGRIRYDFAPGALERSLQGVDVLACAYWTSHDRAPVGHRGPWTSHALAVERSARLIDAAVAAGVSRLVWTSIANPGLDPDLSYYAGKAAVENLVERTGLPHAILRPACFFGPGGILIENVAWAARAVGAWARRARSGGAAEAANAGTQTTLPTQDAMK